MIPSEKIAQFSSAPPLNKLNKAATLPPEIRERITARRRAGEEEAALDPLNEPEVRTAIAREKQLKRWSREKKIGLIEAQNPDWRDLTDDWWE